MLALPRNRTFARLWVGQAAAAGRGDTSSRYGNEVPPGLDTPEREPRTRSRRDVDPAGRS